MKLVVLLSFYDEDPAWLTASILSLKDLPVRHVVALDGAYSLYPQGKAKSASVQHEEITRAAREIGADLTLQAPDRPWEGNEVEKRTALFRLGDQAAEDGDWFCVLDADDRITLTPPDLGQQLATSTFDVAQVTFLEPNEDNTASRAFPLPFFFRATPGIEVVRNHYTYRTADGRYLWGSATLERLEPRLDLPEVVVEHLTNQRPAMRQARAKAYYRTRDKQGVERGRCSRCSAKSTRQVKTNWRLAPGGLAGEFTDVCDRCVKVIAAENKIRLRAYGLDPDNLDVEVRAGPAPLGRVAV